MDNIELLVGEEILWKGGPNLSYEKSVIQYTGLFCSSIILFLMIIHVFQNESPFVLIPYILILFGGNILISLIIRMYLRSYTERLKEPPMFLITNKRIISKDPDNTHHKNPEIIPNAMTIKDDLVIMNIEKLAQFKLIKVWNSWNVWFYLEKGKNAPWWMKFDGLGSIKNIKETLMNVYSFQCSVKKKSKEVYEVH
ncbi:MAG: hypothetical protein ACFFE4_07095 [Candidatus Thorarchaeota archaeon]